MTTLTKTKAKTPAIKERIYIIAEDWECDSCNVKGQVVSIPGQIWHGRLHLCKSCINIAQIKFRFANEDNERKTHR